jgi:iron complex outermembrane receptor protein
MAAGLAQVPAPVLAQAAADSSERITIVGSRRATPASSSIDTTVPVDVYSLTKAAESGGQFDLAQTLQYLSPSFNSTRQTGADGADLIDSAALRGLGSDQTLVLVNGKRRHTVALVNLFGARNRGNTGTDLNAIPLLAIDNVQVLRDGAAAQYGSDAIAGVINIFNPTTLFVHGVLLAGAPDRFARVLDRVKQRTLTASLADCTIVATRSSKRQAAIAGIISHLTNTWAPSIR